MWDMGVFSTRLNALSSLPFSVCLNPAHLPNGSNPVSHSAPRLALGRILCPHLLYFSQPGVGQPRFGGRWTQVWIWICHCEPGFVIQPLGSLVPWFAQWSSQQLCSRVVGRMDNVYCISLLLLLGQIATNFVAWTIHVSGDQKSDMGLSGLKNQQGWVPLWRLHGRTQFLVLSSFEVLPSSLACGPLPPSKLAMASQACLTCPSLPLASLFPTERSLWWYWIHLENPESRLASLFSH